MYRVELKVSFLVQAGDRIGMFLMYRVELKVFLLLPQSFQLRSVPNVPCGVESTHMAHTSLKVFSFLMYRVELKV